MGFGKKRFVVFYGMYGTRVLFSPGCFFLTKIVTGWTVQLPQFSDVRFGFNTLVSDSYPLVGTTIV